MNSVHLLRQLPQALLPWYSKNKRDLPWRRDREAYHVWLSEIMLQQTRVEAVKGYYHRFLQALPDIAALADCPEDKLMKLWEGLGYYSRVRNLRKAARMILDQYGGRFPEEYRQVLALPGIGEYTAGAICSICFDQKTPAVDGNVLRVVSRLTDDMAPIDTPDFKKRTTRALEEIYPEEAGDFTQALMELGATLCGPNRRPDCPNCPCREFCLGYQRGTAESLPVKLPKKQRRREEKTVFILRCGELFALEKRADTGLLAGLWQFPNVSGRLTLEQALDQTAQWGLHVREIRAMVEKKHIFTHIQWNMTGIYLEVEAPLPPFSWLTRQQAEDTAALPTAFRQFFEERDYV